MYSDSQDIVENEASSPTDQVAPVETGAHEKGQVTWQQTDG